MHRPVIRAAIVAAAAAAFTLAPSAGADQDSRMSDAARQADQAAKRSARQLSAYHERDGSCRRTAVRPDWPAIVCRYRFAGWNAAGEHYYCRLRVTMADGHDHRPTRLWDCRD